GVFGSRDLAAVERVFAVAGKTVAAAGGKRSVALLDGMLPTAGSSRRALRFAHRPAGWTELEKNPTAKTRRARLNDGVVWPGKPGVAALAEVKALTPEQQARFENGKALFGAVCA